MCVCMCVMNLKGEEGAISMVGENEREGGTLYTKRVEISLECE